MTLQDAFRDQARACAGLGSPFMAQLLTELGENWRADTALGHACAAFSGDIGASGASLPLRIAGGLHALVLRGADASLAAVYPPDEADAAQLRKAVFDALERHEPFMLDWIKSAPQTNEVRRSAVLIPVAHWLSGQTGAMPLVLSELGASAGLNLMWDRFAVATGSAYLGPNDPALTLRPEVTGTLPAPARLQVAARRGVDLNPLNPQDPSQRLRLFAYLWPDQPHRLDLTRKAIAVHQAEVDQGDAIGWLEQRLRNPQPGRLHLIYHTVAWQYFPADSQARGRALIEAAGARATVSAPLAWFGMEADGVGNGAGLTLRLWPANRQYSLGRADFHGRWLHWAPEETGPAATF